MGNRGRFPFSWKSQSMIIPLTTQCSAHWLASWLVHMAWYLFIFFETRCDRKMKANLLIYSAAAVHGALQGGAIQPRYYIFIECWCSLHSATHHLRSTRNNSLSVLIYSGMNLYSSKEFHFLQQILDYRRTALWNHWLAGGLTTKLKGVMTLELVSSDELETINKK